LLEPVPARQDDAIVFETGDSGLVHAFADAFSTLLLRQSQGLASFADKRTEGVWHGIHWGNT
jgi:hypothetical protein